MKVLGGTLMVLLVLVLVPTLTLALPTPAAGRTPADVPLTAPAADPPPLDCANPLPGKVTRLIADDEILVFCAVNRNWDDSGTMQLVKLDSPSQSTSLVYDWDWEGPTHDVIWPAVTTADLDADGKAEVVGVGKFQDVNGTLDVQAFMNPEVSNSADLQVHGLLGWNSRMQGQELNHFDIAAGNLKRTANGAEQAAVAFRDNDGAVHVLLVERNASGGIDFFGEWWGTNHARTWVGDVSVDVGDLDGDGYDDEIVLAFADGDQDLQVVVLEWNGSWNLSEIGWNYWTGHERDSINLNYAAAIDVTAGDFNGDFKDEVSVSFRDGACNLQVLQVEYDPTSGAVTSPGWWRDTNHHRNDVDMISTASGDIDGDGYDEIVTSFKDGNADLAFVTLDAETGSPQLHGSWASGANDLSEPAWTSVDVGDINADGKPEIVVALQDYNADLQVIAYNDNPDCPCADDDSSGLIKRDVWENHDDGRGDVGMLWIALGDVDGDSIYGDYTGVCTQTTEIRMTALVGRPPYWAALNPDDNEVGYGKSAGSEKESDQEVTTSYGSSVTADLSFLTHDVELGPSIIKDWEHSITSGTITGTQIETHDGWTMNEDGLVPLNGVTYYSYQYKRRDNGALARVGVPVDAAIDAKTISYWNDPTGERLLAPTTWVPAYRSGWMDPVPISDPTGVSSQGAGSDFYDLNGNGTPDYVWAWIDNPAGENAIHYRVGWDVGANGQPASWSATYQMPEPGTNGVGWETAGLGAAVTDLNGNGTPDLVLAWVANPDGENWAAYCVGWDLDATGAVSSWSGKKAIPGWVGGSTQGAGLDILDLNGNGHPELFFGWIDDPADVNQGWYRVGWDLDASGDSSNWWPYPKHIEGAFGPEDAGLGLTLADVNGDGHPELVAAWVRQQTGGNEWAYSIGEGLDGAAYVGSWVPGPLVPSLPVPGPMGSSTDSAALAAADLVPGDGRPELVIGEIDRMLGLNQAWLRVSQYWPLSGDPDQYPSIITDTNPSDGQFQMYVQGHSWNVSGDVNWRWDADPNNQPIVVSVGGANPTWSVDHTQFTEYVSGTSKSYNIEVGWEAEFMGVGVEGSNSYGFEDGSSQSISWDKGWYMEGQTGGLPSDAPQSKQYKYVPYTYMQEARSIAGAKQAYMVLDYIVPYIGPVPLATDTPATAPGVAPGVPLIASPSHPDTGTWYPTSTVVFTWTQPAGDPAVVNGYRWYLDRHPDTVPNEFSQGLTDTTTYQDFSDGLWYLHLRARGQDGDWSATAHRAVRLDGHPPQVQIGLNPPPADNGGWYNTSVTATVTATDLSTSPGQTGSGVASVEVSADGATWQPYMVPLVFNTDRPLTALWARATDAVGHTSEPVSTTFGLDLTVPTSIPGPGCWDPGGGCVAEAFTDTLGNQYLRLAGEVDGSLSGLKGVAIRVNGTDWVPATAVVGNRWFFTSTQEVGAGCHLFDIQAEDRAGNVEPLHPFASGVVWPPRETPDLSGSSLGATPATARPGATVTVTVVARNGGWQEAWVPITAAVPLGLAVLSGTISNDGVYDPAARTVAWPPRTLWPGQERPLSFRAQVDAGLPATALVVRLTALGTWPIAGDCPLAALPAFLAHQTATVVSTTVTVSPTLPAGADVVPPVLYGLRIEGRSTTGVREVSLHLNALPDARWMYLREWTWDADGGTWAVAQESGWLPYRASYPWTLSEGDGVKYLGAWLADAVGNVSVLDSRGLAFTNLLNSRQALAAGQRIQYRFPLRTGNLAVWNVVAHAGNPDLYVWQPWSGFRPPYAAAGTGLVDTVGLLASRWGPYLVEVQAEGDTVYQLLLAGDIAQGECALAGVTPEHPLTVSDPLSAGGVVAPAPPGLSLYLPIVIKNY